MWRRSRELISIDSHFVKVGMGPGSAAHRGPSLNVRLQHIGRAALRPGHEALRDCLLSNCLSRLEAKEYRPLFRLRARGSPSFLEAPLRPSPSRRGGWRADKAHGLDRQAGGGTACGRALGVKRHALRRAIAASSAYASVSDRAAPGALCPWRVSPEAARGSGLRRRPPAGAAPVPRLANASGRRPRLLDRDELHIE